MHTVYCYNEFKAKINSHRQKYVTAKMFSLTAFTQLNNSIYPHAARSSHTLGNLIKSQKVSEKNLVRQNCE